MKKLYCITCPSGCQLTIIGSGVDMVVEGNKCPKGREFADHEMSNPTRTLTTTVRTKFPGVPVLSVRTNGEIPKDKLMAAMKELSEVVIETELNCGDTVVDDVAETGVSVIVTSAALMKLGAELENKNAELERRASSGNPGVASSADTGSGTGSVMNVGILDDIGADAVGGFVGAAGEAVGVEDAEDELEQDETSEEEDRIKQKSRPHIKRR